MILLIYFMFINSYDVIYGSLNQYEDCLKSVRKVEFCVQHFSKGKEELVRRNITEDIFISTLKKILLEKMGLKKEPSFSVKLSSKEREYVKNVTMEIELEKKKRNLKGQKMEIIYPVLRTDTSQIGARRILFWLPDCFHSKCSIEIGKLRTVIRVKYAMLKLPSEVQLDLHLVNQKEKKVLFLTCLTFKSSKHSLLKTFNLDNVMKKIKSYTGRTGIIIDCKNCNWHYMTPAIQALRYGRQKSSLTILWKKQEAETTRHSRGHTCHNCCQLRTKIVQLKDIGWDNWVLLPYVVEFGYCYGKCSDDSVYHTDNSILARKLATQPGFTTCCVPASYSTVKITFMRDKTTIEEAELETLSAQTCACM